MKLIRIPRKAEIRNEIPAALTDDMSISAGAKILWIKLYNSNRGKDKTYQEWKPSTQALATVFNVEKITIKRWMKELKDSGWITIYGSRNDTNVFINYTPVLVSKKIPALVSKKIPFTTKCALASQTQECAHNNTNSENLDSDLDLDNFFDKD